MKIRTDFVTNSSSSSFVGITIKLKNREDISIDFEETGEWNEYYLPDFINGMPLRGKKDSNDAGIFVFSPPLRENVYPGYRERH